MKNIKKFFTGFSILSVATIASLGATFAIGATSINKPNQTPSQPNIPIAPPIITPEEPIIKPSSLVAKENIISSDLGMQNLTIDQALSSITKEWIISNKNLLFESGYENLVEDEITTLSSTLDIENSNNNMANIQIQINDTSLSIRNFELIPSNSSLYNLQGWQLGIGQAINISSYIKDESKIIEAISLYIINQQNEYVNNQKDFPLEMNYVINRRRLFKSEIYNNKLVWDFDLKGKNEEFKNALSLILFKKSWDNLFFNNKSVSNNIVGIKVESRIEQITNNIDKYKIYGTNIELILEQESLSINKSNSRTISSKTINLLYNLDQQISSSYDIIFSKDLNSQIGSVILADNSILVDLEPKNSIIDLESFLDLQNVINESFTKISSNFSKEFVYKNKDLIFKDSYLFSKLNFIEDIKYNGIIGTNYNKFSITIKWKDIDKTTNIIFGISDGNRIKALGLHKLRKTPISGKNLGLYTKSADMSELIKRVSLFIQNEQINPINNIINSPNYIPGYEEYKLDIRPQPVEGSDDLLYASMNFDPNSQLSSIYFKMYFRSIWDMNYVDFVNQSTKDIVPNLDTLNDIQIQWQLLIKGPQNGFRLEAELYPTKVSLIYNSSEKVEWNYTNDFVIENNLITPIHFVVIPSIGDEYKVVDFGNDLF